MIPFNEIYDVPADPSGSTAINRAAPVDTTGNEVVVEQLSSTYEAGPIGSENVVDIQPEIAQPEVCMLETRNVFNQLLDSTVTIQELKETVEETINTESFDAGHSRLLTYAIRGIVAQQEFKGVSELNLESAVVLANTYEHNLSLLNDIQLNMEASVISGVLKAYNAIRENFSAYHRGYGAMQFRAKEADKKLRLVVGSGDVSFTFLAAHRLSVDKHTDIRSIIDGLKRSVAMANEMVSIYYPAVFELIDATTTVVEDSIPPKTDALSTEKKRQIAADGMRKANAAFQKIVNFADVGVVSGEAFLEANGPSMGGADIKPVIRFKTGEYPDARAELKVSRSDIAQVISLTNQLLEATNKIYAAHSGFYNRTIRRYEEFREAYRVNAGFFRKLFQPYPLLITYLSYLAGGNGAIFVPIDAYSHFFKVTRAATKLTDTYFSKLGIK